MNEKEVALLLRRIVAGIEVGYSISAALRIEADRLSKLEPSEWWVNEYQSCDVSYAHKSYQTAIDNLISGGRTIKVREVLP